MHRFENNVAVIGYENKKYRLRCDPNNADGGRWSVVTANGRERRSPVPNGAWRMLAVGLAQGMQNTADEAGEEDPKSEQPSLQQVVRHLSKCPDTWSGWGWLMIRQLLGLAEAQRAVLTEYQIDGRPTEDVLNTLHRLSPLLEDKQ